MVGLESYADRGCYDTTRNRSAPSTQLYAFDGVFRRLHTPLAAFLRSNLAKRLGEVELRQLQMTLPKVLATWLRQSEVPSVVSCTVGGIQFQRLCQLCHATFTSGVNALCWLRVSQSRQEIGRSRCANNFNDIRARSWRPWLQQSCGSVGCVMRLTPAQKAQYRSLFGRDLQNQRVIAERQFQRINVGVFRG